MEIKSGVSAFQNYQNVSDVIAKGTKQSSEKSERTKKQRIKSMIEFQLQRRDYLVKRKNQWIYQFVYNIHSPALFIPRDNSDSKIKPWTDP